MLPKFLRKFKLIAFILILAAALRFIGLYPNVKHPDEGYVQIKSQELVYNLLVNHDPNPHTFKYGQIFFYLQAAVILPVFLISYGAEALNLFVSSNFTSGFLPYSSFHDVAAHKYAALLLILGRAEVAAFGVVGVWIVYLLAKKLFGEKIGLLSALILAIAPFAVRDSHYITTDIPSIFFILLAVLFMVYMISERHRKWFFWGGVALGISSAIRYFPVAFLVLPVVLIFTLKLQKDWLVNVAFLGLGIFVGLFISLPYLFIDPSGPVNLAGDVQKFALGWYGTSISNYLFSLTQGIVLPLNTLLPKFFRPFHASYLFFNGYGVMPSILAVVGIVILLRKHLKAFLILVPIPLFTFIYASSYIPASYERTVLPVVPFLAIFTALTIDALAKIKFKFFAGCIILLAVLDPLVRSSAISVSCQTKDTQDQSSAWVEKNIPDGSKVSYVTMVSVPSTKIFPVYYGLEPDYFLSLEEARSKGADLAFINTGRLDYVTYPFFNDYFVPDKYKYENNYYFLVTAEYQSRAKLLKYLSRNYLCDASRIYYYQIPPKEVGDGIELSDTDVGERVNVESGKTYSYSKWVSGGVKSGRVFLRMDFYDGTANDDDGSGRQGVWEKLDELWLLYKYGPTPVYFERKRFVNRIYSDTNLPGRLVALSPRASLDKKREKLTVTAKPPEGAKYLILRIQND